MSDLRRRITPQVFWRVARNTLGRMACVYADPTADGHDHGECVVDDEAFAAHLLLGLAGALAEGDETTVLDAVTDLLDRLNTQ